MLAKDIPENVVDDLANLIKGLKLEDLPKASKFNLATSLILLVGLIIVAAEPVVEGATHILVVLCNTIISICSTRELLPMRDIDVGNEALICFICLVVEVCLCAFVVFFDGWI